MMAGVAELQASRPVAASDRAPPLQAALEHVRLMARRRLTWVEHLRQGSLGQGGLIAARDLKLALDNLDNVDAERAFRAREPRLVEIDREIEALERRLDADNDSPLAQLCHVFELEPGERDIVHVCLATTLDPALCRVWAALHNHPGHGYPSEALVARLTDSERATRTVRSGSLAHWELVRVGDASPGDPAPLELDPHIFEFLCGQSGADPFLVDNLSLLSSAPAPASWPVAETAERIDRVLSEGYGVRVLVAGPKNSGRRTLAACVSEALGGRTLALDTTGIDDDAWPRFHLHAQRQALLFGGSLVWWGSHVARRYPDRPGLARLQFVIGDSETQLPAQSGVIDLGVEMPRLELEERAALWRRLLPISQAWRREDFAQLVERYHVQIGDIAEVARRGLDEVAAVRSACRSLTRDRLGDLGTLIDCPFTRDDLLLPEKVDRLLDEFLFEARERTRFWEKPQARRLFPRGRGLVALMTGPPGTGKTMAAQIIARDLDLDLFRVDLASSVSKYIGETAKNLRRIFTRAREMNAVLLFDEADALFAKRTEVRDSHDRYANADTNYLLQLLEDHDGIALLASNKRQNIDAAFVRRIRYILEFPRPSPRERLLMWQRLTRELGDAERARELGVTLEGAAAVDMSGAQIKLAVLAAIFLARQARERLAADHVLRGIEREFNKDGRNLGGRERERILGRG